MITVSAKALWWHAPQVCTCGNPDEDDCPHDPGGWPVPMYVGDIEGKQYLTDRYVFLPTERLWGLPHGYGTALNLMPLPRQAAEGFVEWMTGSVSPDPSDRLFLPGRIDSLEHAGFKIRPLAGAKDVHGICGHHLEIVGLVIPIKRTAGDEPDPRARVAV